MGKYLDDLFLYPKSWIDDDAREFAAAARSWAEKEILADRLKYLQNYERLFVEKRGTLVRDIGFERLVLPGEHGGYDWNKPSSAPGILTVFTEIGRADEAISFIAALKYALFAVISMEPNTDKSLLDELAPLYLADGIKNVALVLPGPGTCGEVTALFAGRSVPVDIKAGRNGCTITGKRLRPLGPGLDADLFGVVCMDKSSHPCVAFVPADAKGVRKHDPIKTTGLNACRNADVTFDKVVVPKTHLIMREGAVQELYAWLNLLLGGTSIGGALNFFEILVNWAENRTIKGTDIMKENPLCASVLATVAEEVAGARLMAYSLAHLMAQPEDWGGVGGAGVFTFAQMLGGRIQQGCLNAINRGMELMGSAGYAREWHVEKHWRDVKTIQSWLCGVGSDVPVKMDVARYFYDCKEVSYEAFRRVLASA
jgi:alkylation response protein AidB-like acyl-CoA dehydrogenase